MTTAARAARAATRGSGGSDDATAGVATAAATALAASDGGAGGATVSAPALSDEKIGSKLAADAASPMPSPAEAARAVHGMRTSTYLEAVEAMLSAMSDYQTDNRGDVGSWVREAAIGSLLPMLLLATAHTEAGEIGRLCEHACLTPTQAIKAEEPALPAVPHRETLAAVPRQTLTTARRWSAAEVRDEEGDTIYADIGLPRAARVLPRTVRFLGCARYRRAALQGLCISAGA